MRKILLPLTMVATMAMFASCSKTSHNEPETDMLSFAARAGNTSTEYWGPSISMGSGHIRSFGVLEKDTDKPLQVGFELTPGALQNLPPNHSAPDHNGPHYMVKLHPKVQSSTVFDHLVVDWNAQGHGPDPYLAPHFDFHMYMIPNAQRMQITATDPLSVAPIPAGFLPNDYIGPLGPEPQMGGHCVDVTSPELNGSAFTHTFIYGAYNSKVAFYEPMITLDYLTNGSGGSFTIKQPANFSKPGYYPTRYTVSKDASGKRYVVLSDFVYRN
jgi:hypothetical protein